MSFQAKKPDLLVVDLDGSEGNIYQLMGMTLSILRRSGMNQEELTGITNVIYSQDYFANLLLINTLIGSVVEFRSLNPDIIKLFES